MKRKQGSQGRIAGTLRPRYSSSSAVFAQRGDEWLTEKEKDREFPLRRSLHADTPISPEQAKANKARQDMRLARNKARLHRREKDLIAASIDGDKKRIQAALEDIVHLHEKVTKSHVDFRPPQVAIHVNPDLDMYTKAERAKEKVRFVDPPRQEIKTDAQRKAAAALLNMRKKMRPVEVKERHGRPHKVKGNFYRFDDVAEPVKDQTHYEPRPFTHGEKKK